MLHCVIKSLVDLDHLKQDINSVSSCTSGKFLQFNAINVDKCLSQERGLTSCHFLVFLLIGTALTQVTEYEYLGVVITSNLPWSPHIKKICIIIK